ncbi:MAG TPA: SpoIIE family protein phosphatase [Solirubrobacteraceae bacterium]|nr:SpoIIE family protein phosphatase [Solirubrobacteraceae bacterium]
MRNRVEHGGLTSAENDLPGSIDATRAHESMLAAVIESALDCVIVIDAHGTVLEFNPAAERTFGYKREHAVGRELAELIIPPSLREAHFNALREFDGPRAGSIIDRRIELIGMRADGAEFPVELTVTQIAEHPAKFAGFLRDITDRQKLTEAKDLLAAASAAFDSSLDPKQTMRTIAQTAIPKLADICVIDLIREDGVIGDSVVAAQDQRSVSRLEELRACQPLDMNGEHPVARALRSREPVVVHDLADPDVLDQVVQGDEHRQFVTDAGYQSAVVLTLSARGRLLGALSFLRMRDGLTYDPDHLPLMQDLAKRAAMALDNANLYAERARIAQTLQRSLLPEALPAVDGIQLACVYQPVSRTSDVGGDFYDVFEASSGCWLIVGDVCGKGAEAAAVTALVRHSIRALALQHLSPAQVLRSVNDVMLSHELAGRFATAIVARIDRSSRPVSAVIACAGHPPPILLTADGHAHYPDVSGTLLGVFAQLKSIDVEVDLDTGTTLVLYTDGLPDAGAPTRELSPEELCGHLEGQTDSTAGALVERLKELALARGAGRLRDDVAIIAARIDPS